MGILSLKGGEQSIHEVLMGLKVSVTGVPSAKRCPESVVGPACGEPPGPGGGCINIPCCAI